jgi:hypothetical protein
MLLHEGHEMMTSTIDESQRKAARVAGFTCLLTLAIVVFANFVIHERLIVAGDAAATARNIMAHQRLFRIGIACGLIYSAGLVVLLTSALRDPQTDKSEPCPGCGILEARICPDVGSYDAQSF